MPFWLKLTIAFVVLASALIWSFGADWRTGLELLLMFVAYLSAVIRHLPRVYLFYSRIKYQVLNHETVWRLHLELQGVVDPSNVMAFFERLATDACGDSRIVSTAPNTLVLYRRAIGIIEIVVDSPGTGLPEFVETGEGRMSVTVVDQRISYRSSKRVMEQHLIPLFEDIWNTFKPERGKFTLTVMFEGPNPFFGLYVEQMSLDRVRDFAFEFTIPTANKDDYVRVAKDHMTVVSSSLQGLRLSALQCLAFEAPVR